MIRNTYYHIQRLLGIGPEQPLLSLYHILGFFPRDIRYYELALTHSSASITTADGKRINNERLEFLGDSVLGTAVSKYLYLEHADWDEGEMSKRRSALVKRATNNAVSEEMGIGRLLRRNESSMLSRDAYGDAFEALIGAIFLDQGYAVAERFVVERVLPLFQALEVELMEKTANYKSLVIEWAQHHHLKAEFRMLAEPKRSGGTFVCAIYIDDKRISIGRGSNKKEAHQEAAHAALEALKAAEPDIAQQLSAFSS